MASGTSDRLGMTSLAMIQLATSHLKTNDSVLDFGCGWGVITNEIARDVKYVEGLDPASRMIELARNNARKHAIENVIYTQADLFDSRYQPQSFDAILAFNVLHYLDNAPDILRRMHDLLKTGGVLITSTACLKERWSAARVILWLLSKLHLMPRTSFYKKKELEKVITAGGFDLVETAELTRLPEYFIVAKKHF
jgi:2-polyprenyl-3-methyl-5-hydroxy-6-metoxy-1,4-benzoquinol methylase